MSSAPDKPKSFRRRKRRVTRRTSSSRRLLARSRRARRSCFNNGGGTCSEVSDKLEALKSLIPSHYGEIVKPDQLFQETADYIVFLRTQVVILQRLIELYGSSGETTL
ncbi:hypothetical protein CJ030_MR6G013255 [Morella rubra]|uniref:Transcription factor UPBEAT1 n=1 Tax=Morella rubra TaxID=262757 RepID=A0A6A1VFM9_9ROSI|nr:hypothetical protein CJ030_MR6G013255 [Morella rubra]